MNSFAGKLESESGDLAVGLIHVIVLSNRARLRPEQLTAGSDENRKKKKSKQEREKMVCIREREQAKNEAEKKTGDSEETHPQDQRPQSAMA